MKRRVIFYIQTLQKKRYNNMFPFVHFVKGALINIFNPRVSLFAFVSSSAAIDRSAFIYRGVKIKEAMVGAHTYIAAHTEIENAEIGKFCSIADHCRIGMSGHAIDFLSTSPVFTQKMNALQVCWINKDVFEHKTEEERVVVGNDVWVGSHVLIKGGVHIGDGACIAAGAVVVKDVPPYAIVGGVPAQIIKYRFTAEMILKLEKINWWNWNEEQIKENITLFQTNKIDMDSLIGGVIP